MIDAVATTTTTGVGMSTSRGHAFRHSRRSTVLRWIQCDSFCDRSTSAEGSSLRGTTSTPPTTYVFNVACIAKPNAIEQLGAELIGYDVDVAVITETHLKKKHPDSCVDIDNYVLFRRDRVRRKGGGVAIYVRQSVKATVYKPPVVGDDPSHELL